MTGRAETPPAPRVATPGMPVSRLAVSLLRARRRATIARIEGRGPKTRGENATGGDDQLFEFSAAVGRIAGAAFRATTTARARALDFMFADSR